MDWILSFFFAMIITAMLIGGGLLIKVNGKPYLIEMDVFHDYKSEQVEQP